MPMGVGLEAVQDFLRKTDPDQKNPTLPSEVVLTPTTADERRRQTTINNVTIAQIIINNGEKALENSDAAIGSASYILFGIASTCYAKGEYGNALFFFLLSGLVTIAKHRLPEGPVVKWLRRSPTDIIKNIRDTLNGRKK